MGDDRQSLRRDPHRGQSEARPPLRLRRHGPAHRQDGDQQERDHGRQVCDHLATRRATCWRCMSTSEANRATAPSPSPSSTSTEPAALA